MLNPKIAREIVRDALTQGVKFRTFHVIRTYPGLLFDSGEPAEEEVGKVTVAVKKVGESGNGNGDGSIYFDAGLAFCSPKDNYSKKVGQALAYGRVNVEKRKIHFTIPTKKTSVKETLKTVIADYVSKHEIGWLDKNCYLA